VLMGYGMSSVYFNTFQVERRTFLFNNNQLIMLFFVFLFSNDYQLNMLFEHNTR